MTEDGQLITPDVNNAQIVTTESGEQVWQYLVGAHNHTSLSHTYQMVERNVICNIS